MDKWHVANLSQEQMKKLKELESELDCVLIAYNDNEGQNLDNQGGNIHGM